MTRLGARASLYSDPCKGMEPELCRTVGGGVVAGGRKKRGQRLQGAGRQLTLALTWV